MRNLLPRIGFIDETSLKTNMAKTTGWSPKGARLIDHAPFGHWKTQTFIAALRHDRLDLFLRSQFIETLRRLHARKGESGPLRRIDFRNVIESLRRKPRALLHCRYQRELFPDERWWQLWQQLRNSGDRDAAARLMVEALYVGCRVAGYEPVLAWLEKAHQRQGLSLRPFTPFRP